MRSKFSNLAFIFLVLGVLAVSGCTQQEDKSKSVESVGQVSENKTAEATLEIPIELIQIPKPSIKILSPKNGEKLKGGAITVKVEVKNLNLTDSVPIQAAQPLTQPREGEGHIHLILGNGYITTKETEYTFENLEAGKYNLIASLHGNNHDSLDIEDEIEITVEKPEPPKPEYPDSFDGTVINTTKYSMKINGPGSILQDNKIIETGKTNYGILWNVFYTNNGLDFTKDFTISADIDLSADVSSGDGMLIIGIERRTIASSATKPAAGYCEISVGPHGKIIRMASSGEHATQVSKTKGKIILSYSTETSMFTCTLDNQKIEEKIRNQAGDFVLTLRSGLHDIRPGGDEYPVSGSINATFDNLDLAVK